jgi:hypothetical protein
MSQYEWRFGIGPYHWNLLSDELGGHVEFSRRFSGLEFHQIDYISGQVLRPGLLELVEIYVNLIFERLKPRHARTLSMKLSASALSMRLKNWHIARRFAGWSVCFEKSSMFDSGEAFLEGFTTIISKTDDPYMPEQELIENSGLEHAYKCFHDAFPNGKGETTWSVVEARTGYSRRQINRALKLYSGPDGQTGGQDSGQTPI